MFTRQRKSILVLSMYLMPRVPGTTITQTPHLPKDFPLDLDYMQLFFFSFFSF